MDLVSGQNTLIEPNNIGITFHIAKQGGIDIASNVFLLDSSNKVASNNDFVYSGNPERSDICVCQDINGGFSFILDALPANVQKIVFALNIPDGVETGKRFMDLGKITITVQHFISKKSVCTFCFDTQDRTETALIMGELYLRNGQWKFKALGQGFLGGLPPLAERYGVDLNTLKKTATPPPQPAPAPASFDETPQPKPVSLSKITLEKKGNSVSLEKKPNQQFGEILINLNWDQPKKTLFGRTKSVDLDLGCLFAFKDGFIGGVQALGNMFGSLEHEPFIRLDADDRSGASVGGENLRINGKHWDKLQRVLVFGFIYEGAPNWSQSNAVVTLKVPSQPDIEVRLDSHNNRRTMCAIAMLENDNGAIKVTKLIDYFVGHQDMDKAYQWGLRYTEGSK